MGENVPVNSDFSAENSSERKSAAALSTSSKINSYGLKNFNNEDISWRIEKLIDV